jgi:hypothetical protein
MDARQHTLARIKKIEHVRTTDKKSKVDKKDDTTIILFFLFYFSDYIVWPSTIKKRRLWSITEVSNIFWGKESSQH